MAMGTRKQREKQEGIWIAQVELASAPGHPFYQRLNGLLESEGFDAFVEGRCAKHYATHFGRPSLTPGIYFRSLLIGYFEGLDSERGIAWRLADSLGAAALRGNRSGRDDAGSLNDLADAAAHLARDPSRSVRMGAEPAGGS